jgi:hypothetical protein
MQEPSINAVSWNQETKRSPFPFVDVATLKDASGLLTLSPSWILDARLWPAMTTPAKVYLQSIERSRGLLRFTVASTEEVLCTAEVSDFTKRRLAFFSAQSTQAGFMSFAAGALQHIYDRPSARYLFPVEATEFVPAAVTPALIAGLGSVKDNKGNSVRGTVRVVGGEGVSLHVIPGNKIRVDVIGDPFYRRDICDNVELLGRLINPVRYVAWRDVTSGANGVARPLVGRIVTSIISTKADPRHRGFTSPDEDGAILGMLGA